MTSLESIHQVKLDLELIVVLLDQLALLIFAKELMAPLMESSAQDHLSRT